LSVAIYGKDGTVLAASQSLARNATAKPAFLDSWFTGHGAGGFATINNSLIYVYALPLHHDSLLVTFHDASYIEAQSIQIWRETLWHILLQVLSVVLITLVIVHSAIVRAIRRLSQWVKDMRDGKLGTPLQPAPAFFPESLVSELAHLGRSLAETQTAASQEARLRDAGDSMWTAERLRAAVTRRLGGSSLFVVSNCEPYHHIYGDNGIEIQVPASGLATALEPILNACGGTWVAHGSASADRETVDEHDLLRVPPDDPHYTLRRVWLTAEEKNGYYSGFSNEGIWPLCHTAHTRPSFRAADWECYRRVNQKFASAALQEIEQSERPTVFVQDYHFALLPRLIKAARPDARVGIFWHIPWPNPQAFRICPWQYDLLDGLLGADVVAFHIQAHCNNFLETVDQAFECRIEWDRFSVSRKNHITAVRPHPISVVFRENVQAPPNNSGYLPNRDKILPILGPETIFLGLGVDRLDYTKGILERFRAIERFLDKYPQYCWKFTFVQFGAPSRTGITRYRDFLTEVEQEVKRINGRFQTDRWKPIVLYTKHHSHEEIEPFYKAASPHVGTKMEC
jgi:trehalose-6-phosphate synthase